MKLNEYVQYVKGHKDSKGNVAPWVIRSHETKEIISSHTSRADAEKHLQQMHAHEGTSSILKKIREGNALTDYYDRVSEPLEDEEPTIPVIPPTPQPPPMPLKPLTPPTSPSHILASKASNPIADLTAIANGANDNKMAVRESALLKEKIDISKAYETEVTFADDPGYTWDRTFDIPEMGKTYVVSIFMGEIRFDPVASPMYATVQFSVKDLEQGGHIFDRVTTPTFEIAMRIFDTVANEIVNCYKANPNIKVWMFGANKGEMSDGEDTSRMRAYRTIAKQLADYFDWNYGVYGGGKFEESYFVVSPDISESDLDDLLDSQLDATDTSSLKTQLLKEGMSKNYAVNRSKHLEPTDRPLDMAAPISFGTTYEQALALSKRIANIGKEHPEKIIENFFETLNLSEDGEGGGVGAGAGISGGANMMTGSSIDSCTPEHMLGITSPGLPGNRISNAKKRATIGSSSPWDKASSHMGESKLQEGFLSSFSYKVPSSPTAKDLRSLFFDFYFLNGYVYDQDFGRDEINWNMNETFHIVVEYLRDHFARAVKYSLSAEFRHAMNRTQGEESNLSPETLAFIKVYAKNMSANKVSGNKVSNYMKAVGLPGEHDLDEFQDEMENGNRYGQYGAAFIALEKTQEQLHVSNIGLAQIMIDCYMNSNRWREHNGKLWSRIALEWSKMIGARDWRDAVIHIDTLFSLQHKSGSVFNKLRTYYDESDGYDWIVEALDWKMENKSLRAFAERVSPQMRPLVQYIAYHKDRK